MIFSILLMLIGATGVAASTADYPLLLSVIMAPVGRRRSGGAGREATGEPVDYPDAGYDIVSLAPTVALLVGAALAFLARSRSRRQPTSC